MNIFAEYNQVGNYNLIVNGVIGDLEVELIIPENPDFRFLAIIGHPHSLYGGTMHNKVVTTLSSVYSKLNIPSIKFNFRGVGKSHGEYDAGIGESMDMLLLVKLWKEIYPKAKLFFAGFSFGSYVAYRAAAIFKLNSGESTSLITIAPSVNKYDYKEYSLDSTPWLIVQGDNDEIVDAKSVYDFAKSFTPSLKIFDFENTGHFFHGKLIELKSRLIDYLSPSLIKS